MKPKKNDGHNQINKKIRQHILGVTTLCVMCFSLVAGIFAYTRISTYENGILEVCAMQQDAYVQLVLDQINLKDNRDDEQIINDILGTMDSSSNKYWTFSKSQSMLFVKDVLETNKYKGVTPTSYYVSDSAKKFIKGLEVNRVTHGYIEISGNMYVASGVSFEYKDELYRMCLLTDKDVLLDNNQYLQIKIQMKTFIVVILLVFIVVSMFFAHRVKEQQIKIDSQKDTIDTLNVMLSKMNQKLMDRDLHDTRNNVWEQRAIVPFIDKLVQRNISPVTLIHIHCMNEEQRDRFISRAVYILDDNVIRFRYLNQDIVLIFVEIGMEQADKSIAALIEEGIVVENTYTVKGQADADVLRDRFGEHAL